VGHRQVGVKPEFEHDALARRMLEQVDAVLDRSLRSNGRQCSLCSVRSWRRIRAQGTLPRLMRTGVQDGGTEVAAISRENCIAPHSPTLRPKDLFDAGLVFWSAQRASLGDVRLTTSSRR